MNLEDIFDEVDSSVLFYPYAHDAGNFTQNDFCGKSIHPGFFEYVKLEMMYNNFQNLIR